MSYFNSAPTFAAPTFAPTLAAGSWGSWPSAPAVSAPVSSWPAAASTSWGAAAAWGAQPAFGGASLPSYPSVGTFGAAPASNYYPAAVGTTLGSPFGTSFGNALGSGYFPAAASYGTGLGGFSGLSGFASPFLQSSAFSAPSFPSSFPAASSLPVSIAPTVPLALPSSGPTNQGFNNLNNILGLPAVSGNIRSGRVFGGTTVGNMLGKTNTAAHSDYTVRGF